MYTDIWLELTIGEIRDNVLRNSILPIDDVTSLAGVATHARGAVALVEEAVAVLGMHTGTALAGEPAGCAPEATKSCSGCSQRAVHGSVGGSLLRPELFQK